MNLVAWNAGRGFTAWHILGNSDTRTLCGKRCPQAGATVDRRAVVDRRAAKTSDWPTMCETCKEVILRTSYAPPRIWPPNEGVGEHARNALQLLRACGTAYRLQGLPGVWYSQADVDSIEARLQRIGTTAPAMQWHGAPSRDGSDAEDFRTEAT